VNSTVKCSTTWSAVASRSPLIHSSKTSTTHILARACRPGDLVLDPFAGSGTSRDAAVKLGLAWRGCAIDPQFAETGDTDVRLRGRHDR
jgi:tRNA G10  N-methylase Trm11